MNPINLMKRIKDFNLGAEAQGVILFLDKVGKARVDDMMSAGFKRKDITALFKHKYLKTVGHYRINMSESDPIFAVNYEKLGLPKEPLIKIKTTTTAKETKKEYDMNTNRMINCLYENLHAVQVVFQGGDKEYTYKTFDMFEIGEHCIVDSPRDGFVIVRVVGIDDSRLEDDHRFKWVVQKLDLKDHNDRLNNEELAMDKISKLIREKRRKESVSEIETLLGSTDNLARISNELNGHLSTEIPESTIADGLRTCEDCGKPDSASLSLEAARWICTECYGKLKETTYNVGG